MGKMYGFDIGTILEHLKIHSIQENRVWPLGREFQNWRWFSTLEEAREAALDRTSFNYDRLKDRAIERAMKITKDDVQAVFTWN